MEAAMYKMERNKLYLLWLYLFMGSFLVGILIMNFLSEQMLTESGIFNQTTINRLKYLEIDGKQFFPYVLKSRIKEYLLLILLSTTGIGLIGIYLDIVWTGLLTGMFLTATAIKFGMKGMLLIVAGILPHQLLLFPAGFMLLGWCYENCCQKCFPNKKEYYIRQGIILVWIFAVLLIGCILESYVNPLLLYEMIKIF